MFFAAGSGVFHHYRIAAGLAHRKATGGVSGIGGAAILVKLVCKARTIHVLQGGVQGYAPSAAALVGGIRCGEGGSRAWQHIHCGGYGNRIAATRRVADSYFGIVGFIAAVTVSGGGSSGIGCSVIAKAPCISIRAAGRRSSKGDGFPFAKGCCCSRECAGWGRMDGEREYFGVICAAFSSGYFNLHSGLVGGGVVPLYKSGFGMLSAHYTAALRGNYFPLVIIGIKVKRVSSGVIATYTGAAADVGEGDGWGEDGLNCPRRSKIGLKHAYVAHLYL